MVIKKNKIVAALLAFFFGGLGIHKFYLGRVGQGILYILFCWTGIPSIIAFIEFIIFLYGSEEAFDQKYNFYYFQQQSKA
ncbi:TM2 domain-containing protein [Bacillus sp. AGSP2]|uniref:TM2 domain-containing protein n=1 Tax=Bacillus sp. AGSP2 TaxID=3015212 RepID=UPI002360FEB7|nr:TM2 domain-containing protein [Bacillus sp. AGSP2]